MSDPFFGRQFGDYVVQSLLGRGGMARVYKGYDERLQRFAAVKIISTELAVVDQAEYAERFQREARAIARLYHPNIVGIYQFGDYENGYYMAMVFVEGKDLRQILREYNTRGELLPWTEVLNIVQGIGSALDYAHNRGVIHRDIKPSNIMINTENQPILTDFGLALSTSEGTLGDTFGSAHYIAPEQAVSSAKAVPQSDLYSLGVCTYEMLTGRVPFDDPSAMSVALKHLNDPPPALHDIIPNIPPAVEMVVLKTLQKDPEQRYLNGAAMAQALAVAMGLSIGPTASILGGVPKPKEPLESWDEPLPEEEPEPSPSQPKPPLPLPPPVENVETKPTLPPPARPGRDRTVPTLVASFIVMLVIAGIAALVVAQSSGDRGGTATAVAVVTDAATEPATSEAVVTAPATPEATAPVVATDVPTPIVTEQATVDSTPTEQATVEPTAVATAAPTAAPTQQATEAAVLPTAEPTQAATKAATQASDSPTPSRTASQTTTPTRTLTVTRTPSATNTERPTRTPSPTRTQTATRTASRTPTATRTSTATRTPSRTATATRTTTRTPSATPSATVTLTLEGTAQATGSGTPVTASTGDILLLYSEEQFNLINVSGRVLNVAELVFEQRANFADPRRFEGARWDRQGVVYGPYNLPPQWCFQILRVDIGDVKPFERCDKLSGFVNVASPRWFWVPANSLGKTFDVLLEGNKLATCTIAEQRCEFKLP